VLAINGPSARLNGRLDALKAPTRELEEWARRIAQWRRRPTIFDGDQPTFFDGH
jgi:hypothetical protein